MPGIGGEGGGEGGGRGGGGGGGGCWWLLDLRTHVCWSQELRQATSTAKWTHKRSAGSHKKELKFSSSARINDPKKTCRTLILWSRGSFQKGSLLFLNYLQKKSLSPSIFSFSDHSWKTPWNLKKKKYQRQNCKSELLFFCQHVWLSAWTFWTGLSYFFNVSPSTWHHIKDDYLDH